MRTFPLSFGSWHALRSFGWWHALRSSFEEGGVLRELLIVIFGVLIALWTSDWYSRQTERARETEYLQRLELDLRRDSALLHDVYFPGLEQKERALATIAPYVRGRSLDVPDTLAFLRELGMGGTVALASAVIVSRPTMDDLLSTGNLRLIRNHTLRTSIINYYRAASTAANRIDARRSGYALTVHRLMPAEMRGKFDRSTIEPFDLERIFARVGTEEFEDVLNQEINFTIFAKDALAEFAVQRIELQRQIRAEIRAAS